MNETAELIQQQNLQALMRKQVEQTTKLLEKEEQNSRTSEIADSLKTIEKAVGQIADKLNQTAKRLDMIEAMLVANHARNIIDLAQARGEPIPERCQTMLLDAIKKYNL